MSENRKWVEDERVWWQDHYKKQLLNGENTYKGSPARPQGYRHYYYEMLFRHIRPTIKDKLWIDIGAGTSDVIADLINPKSYDFRYVATDISDEGLKVGRSRTGQTPVISSALSLPFSSAKANIVSGFGILHHIPEWQKALNSMVNLLKPGGYLFLFEAITKPRVLGSLRKQSYTAGIDSPHEGDVDLLALKTECQKDCDIMIWDFSGSPLRFALFHFFNLEKICLQSYAATVFQMRVDKLWLNTLGKVHPSLGASDITILAKKRVQ